MTLDIQTKKQQSGSTGWIYVLLALICAATAVWLFFFAPSPDTASNSAYRFTVNQSATSSANYLDSSYFDETTPRTAYIRDLTHTIDANFSYLFTASEPTNLRYTYSAAAVVTATDTPRGTDKKNNVWQATFPLIQTTSQTVNGNTIRIDTPVTVPFMEYVQKVSQLNQDLALTLSSNLDVRFTVTVTGEVDGVPVNDTRSMQLTMSLSDSIFTITPNIEARATGVAGEESTQTLAWWQRYRLLLTIVAVVATVSFAIIPLIGSSRRQGLARSPYQRKLAKIYRYHDGVIIKTSRPIQLGDREIIEVSSFDDLLNLSDELHTPIISGRAGDEATRFVVLHDRTVYSFIVGRIVSESTAIPIPTKHTKAKK